MNKLLRIASLWLLFLPILASGQNGVTYKISGDYILATIQLNKPKAQIDSIVKSFGFRELEEIETQKSELGWVVKSRTSSVLVLSQNKKENTKELPNAYTMGDINSVDIQAQTHADYGVNSFKQRSVFTEGSQIRFTLNAHQKAKQVYLSGTFNGWSTLATPMRKTANGWEVALPLKAGKHVYKFIVDGKWLHDPQNNKREDDGNGGYNSVYFVANYIFDLAGFATAKKVSVAGSFTNWQPLNLLFNESTNSWRGVLYLREGTHAYKFIVDGKWILDPANSVVREDGSGNKNSFTSVGDTFYFRLPGFLEAKKITVAGDFNGWNFDELTMLRSKQGWVLPYVLPAGNFQYKFQAFGKKIADPNNPHACGTGDFRNSVLAVKPNKTFVLRGFANAKSVALSGSFNGWNQDGFTLERTNGVWHISVFLPPGKHHYKFIVDGKWMIDPANELWEENEHKTKNSILWVESPGLN
jgi:hypothetical protein